jgi:CheY-like chemotaxis protein
MSSVPKTILIVEDDPDSREMFIELLRGGGYFVFAAANGKDAMKFLVGNSLPDAILLDMFMPEMDGWQFRRAQDTDSRLAAIPVIVVSAVAAAENSAVRAGAVGFFQKPVATDQLLHALARLWPGDAAPEPASAEGVSEIAAVEERGDSADVLIPVSPSRPV